MKIEQLDQHCELYEQCLKNGDKLSPEQFLRNHGLSGDEDLMAALRDLEQECRRGEFPFNRDPNPQKPEDVGEATTPMPSRNATSEIDGYKLLQKIGEGGMGVVYMAEQSHPVNRRVALKVIKPGMDSGEILARFEAERQALAMMDHPNIARVLDAGTTSQSVPYFAMELVKGIPISAYCDERKLSLRERLELFIPVCLAVQHAHQKGIIHRDLKPTNILVAQYDGRPVPKVIDFGLA